MTVTVTLRGALAITLLAGCLDAFAPDVGPRTVIDPDAAIATCNTDSDPAVSVSFSANIVPIIDNQCQRCHNPSGSGFRDSGLDLSTYATLRAGGTRSAAAIVIPGSPCDSILVQKIGVSPPFGARMPRGDAPLSSAQQALIHDWIAEGALDN